MSAMARMAMVAKAGATVSNGMGTASEEAILNAGRCEWQQEARAAASTAAQSRVSKLHAQTGQE